MAKQLPDEILHALLDELSTDDVKSLRSVCKAFDVVTSRRLFAHLQVTSHGREGDQLDACLRQYSLLPVSQNCSSIHIRSRKMARYDRSAGFHRQYLGGSVDDESLSALLGHVKAFRFTNVDAGASLAPVPGCLDTLFHGMRDSLASLTICGSFFDAVFTSMVYGVDGNQPPFFPRLEQLRIRRLENDHHRNITNCYSVTGFIGAHLATLHFCQVFVDYFTLKDQDRLFDASGEPPPFVLDRGHDGFRQPSDMHPGVWQVLHQLLSLGTMSLMKTDRPEYLGEDFGWVWVRHGREDRFRGSEEDIF